MVYKSCIKMLCWGSLFQKLIHSIKICQKQRKKWPNDIRSSNCKNTRMPHYFSFLLETKSYQRWHINVMLLTNISYNSSLEMIWWLKIVRSNILKFRFIPAWKIGKNQVEGAVDLDLVSFFRKMHKS